MPRIILGPLVRRSGKQDVTGPIVTGVQAVNITLSSFVVSWTTDEASTSQVDYGTTTGYTLGPTTLDTAKVKTHLVTITGLSASTLYHFRIRSADLVGNLTIGSDNSITTVGSGTDVTPPVISSIVVSNITLNSATISWSLNEYATGQVEYGLTTAYGTFSTPELSFLYQNHVQTLGSLQSNVLYHFRVRSQDASGNLAISTDQTFTTSPSSSLVISGITVTNQTSTAFTVNWNCSIPANGQVEYGLTTTYGSATTLETALGLSHSQSPAGLSPGTTYHFRCRSDDGQGHLVFSPDQVASTLGATGAFPNNRNPLTYVARPTIPSLPALYTPITDPTWGTTIRRISGSGQRHAYSKLQPWNADASLLFQAYGGRLLDGNNYSLVSTALGNPGYFQWHPQNPVYGYSSADGDANLYRWDLTNPLSPTMNSIHNFGRGISIGQGEGHISENGWIALMDTSGNACTYNVDSGSVSNWWPTGGAGGADYPNWITMSHDGTWAIAGFGGGGFGDGTGTGQGVWVYNRDGSNARNMCDLSRHGDTAIDTAGNQVYVTVTYNVKMFRFDNLAGTNLIGFSNAYGAGHGSGRATGRPGWFYMTDYQSSGTQPGMDQLTAVKLDGSGTVEIFGFQNHASASYDAQPHGVPSPDGQRFLFASDWNQGWTTGGDFVASVT